MIYCNIKDLHNESDVEQKLIVPLIVGDTPEGFGYSKTEFLSKPTIKKLPIDKGNNKKSYRPDFIVIIKGVPILIIEAKSPNEQLDEGYREARLYANELNATFKTGINPCTKVLASNGKEIWYGNSDNVNILGQLNFNEIVVSNENFEKLLDFCSKAKISRDLDIIIERARGSKQFHKPIAILGGYATREEELNENLFGTALMYEYQRIFNPETYTDRINVIKNAYIPSKEIEKNRDPIRKIILATNPPSITNAVKIKDTSKPQELFKRFIGKQKLSNQLLLLIGNVGSGKTTFIDYIREVSLPSEAKKKTTWVYVDLNNAPISKNEIYKWTQNQIIEQLRQSCPGTYFDSIDELRKLYSKDVKAFKDGEGVLLENDQKEYNKALATLIQNAKADKDKTTKSYIRYLCSERGKTFVLVLDNCDKRSKEEQFLVFNVAKWAKEEYQALVFLALRDVTYDLHRTEPPLDTVIKDMTFRIDPPKLSDVLYRRVAYAMNESQGEIIYSLKNNIAVKVPKKQQKEYFAYMLKSLYDSTPLAKKLIDGLSGRDIRRGIEIFIAFCKSGHISPERIFEIRTSKGKYKVESHIIMRALLRGNKRFYSDKNSYIKNLFQSYPVEEKRPDPFIRISILNWFEKKKGIKGPCEVKGFHGVSSLIEDLQLLGHDEERILNEVVFLLKERCLISEAQIEETLTETDSESIRKNINNNDLIKIASAGVIHLDLLLNLSYLAACSEDVWFENQKTAQDIAARLTKRKGVGHFSLSTAINNSVNLINYLIDYHKKYYIDSKTFIENDLFHLDLDKIRDFIRENKERFERRNDDLKERYPIGTELHGFVTSYKKGIGIIINLGSGVRGLISEKSIIGPKQKYQPGTQIDVVINDFDGLRGSFILSLKK